MASSNGKRSSETESSLELLRVQQAADRINKRIALGHSIEFRSVFVKEIFPVKKAFVMDRSLFIDAGPFGELAGVQRNWLLKLRTEKGLAQAVNLAGPFIMSSQGKPWGLSNDEKEGD
jgi:hypothetical protein